MEPIYKHEINQFKSDSKRSLQGYRLRKFFKTRIAFWIAVALIPVVLLIRKREQAVSIIGGFGLTGITAQAFV